VNLARPTQRQRATAQARLFAAENASDGIDVGLSFAELLADVMTLRPTNRASRRAGGWRSGYTNRLRVRLAMTHDLRRLDAIEDDPARLARHHAKRAAASERKKRVAARIANKRERLGLV
jgi:hypothetical protein